MGFNTTVVVLNDALHHIRDDKDFGMKLYNAVTMIGRGWQDVSAGSHCNAARVIETHHADCMHAVLVGGNSGVDLDYVGGYPGWPARPLGQPGGEVRLYRVAAKEGEQVTPLARESL